MIKSAKVILTGCPRMKGSELTGVSVFRQEGGRRLAIEMGFDRFQNEFKGRSALKCASGYDCP